MESKENTPQPQEEEFKTYELYDDSELSPEIRLCMKRRENFLKLDDLTNELEKAIFVRYQRNKKEARIIKNKMKIIKQENEIISTLMSCFYLGCWNPEMEEHFKKVFDDESGFI
jgi:hypothetical protein